MVITPSTASGPPPSKMETIQWEQAAWQSRRSGRLPCVKGGGTACRDGGIVKNSLKQPLSQLR